MILQSIGPSWMEAVQEVEVPDWDWKGEMGLGRKALCFLISGWDWNGEMGHERKALYFSISVGHLFSVSVYVYV